MCGIAGILGELRPDDLGRVEAMTRILVHRGPDGGRITVLPNAILGFRRLSIIDLDNRAMQPMTSEDGNLRIVFNGEIYNYLELRRSLQDRYSFRTESDTEVLLAAYRVWGEGCLDRLIGMFAFCIYDGKNKTAFFARDRFGQKPFYYAVESGRLIFASEAKAILAAGVQARVDCAVWARYLVSASYDDAGDTYFKGIRQLAPGECASWKFGGALTVQKYYRLRDHLAPRDMPVATAAEMVRHIMVNSCQLHMRSDVPVAIALSGGLDSSSMIACLDVAGELREGVESFSVEFGADFSERRWIEAAAAHHHVPSSIVNFGPEEFRASIEPMIWHHEGPLGGLMNCGLHAVIAAAHGEGFKVIQDGSGLDEAFGGYRNHHNMYLADLLASGSPELPRAVSEYARNWDVSEADALAAARREASRPVTAIDGTVPTRPDLLSEDFRKQYSGAPPACANSGDRLRDSLIDYMEISKIPRNNRMMDRVSMAYGMEMRLPFLDHRILEVALSIPSALFFWQGRTKGIVREAMAGLMDDDVRLAAKRSIQAPQGPWLRRVPMRDYVEDLITSASFGSRGIFDVAKVKTEFDHFCDGRYDNSFFVWQWINVEEWFRKFIDTDAAAAPLRLTNFANTPGVEIQRFN